MLKLKLSIETLKQTDRLFALYREGNHSVREIARINNIPFTTLRDRFRSRYGIYYTNYRAGEGTLNQVVLEILSTIPKTSRSYREARRWVISNKTKLQGLARASQHERGTRLYTNARIKRDTYINCCSSQDLASSPYLGTLKYAPCIEEDGELIYLHST